MVAQEVGNLLLFHFVIWALEISASYFNEPFANSLAGKKKEGELCGDAINNCEDGLSCKWDGQDNGVGICRSIQGIQYEVLSLFRELWYKTLKKSNS